jgi:hypothetical protein
VVLGLVFNFLKDIIILDSVKNVLPPGKPEKFNFYQVLEDAANLCRTNNYFKLHKERSPAGGKT